MECSEVKEFIDLYLNGELDGSKRQFLDKHLETCSECREEFAAISKMWQLMGEVTIPEPSATMQAEFNAMLRNYKAEHASRRFQVPTWFIRVQEIWEAQLRPYFAVSIAMVFIGFIIGFLLNKPGNTTTAYHKQIDSLTSEVADMKQVMMLTLLQDPSASERIRAVSYTEGIEQADEKVINALFVTLNADPNVNVRLVTLEALLKYANNYKVREGLVHSLAVQDSPLMQASIADVMVKLQEKRSVETMRKLLKKKDLNEMVKVKIEQSIHKLI
jgi:hypothetical protein